MYYDKLMSGDLDLMEPLFNMYANQLAIKHEYSEKWYNHSGILFFETSYFWDLRRARTTVATATVYRIWPAPGSSTTTTGVPSWRS